MLLLDLNKYMFIKYCLIIYKNVYCIQNNKALKLLIYYIFIFFLRKNNYHEVRKTFINAVLM